MERLHTNRSRTLRTAVLAASSLAALAGCGGGSNYKNNPRPAVPINISASVSDQQISVSPSRFGAGPIVVIVTNQSARSQEVTLESQDIGASHPGVKQTTSPINPQDTGELKVDVPEGHYVLRVGKASIRPASITVAGKRRSAQNYVLQP
jgi:hypothetical protein